MTESRTRITGVGVIIQQPPQDAADFTDDQTTDTVQLGDPPSPLPEPVAELMRAYADCSIDPARRCRSTSWKDATEAGGFC
ncbi:hypothetical protein [Streptomyces sp. NPDC046685]|uniref:hypothetical protein n=1 Tax=Streptomyces sp. NPDC046685 TaxID=3157202 RepID=UPI0033CC155F